MADHQDPPLQSERPRLTILNPYDPAVARAARLELARRAAIQGEKLFQKKAKEVRPDFLRALLDRCHRAQELLLLDLAERIALLTPRRVGKTTFMMFKVILTDLRYPGSAMLYIVPDSRKHARQLFWKPLREANEKLKLGYEFYEADHRVTTPSGTDIFLLAAHDTDSITQVLGDAYSAVFCDECKAFGAHFEELLLEGIIPALNDYGGTLVLASSPGKIQDGYFYKATTGQIPGYSVHKWTKADNTFLRAEARDLDLLALDYPKGKEDARYKRDVLGEWACDDDERVYQYDVVRNGWDGVLPEGPHQWMYVTGADFGERDKNAFAVWAFAPTDRYVYLVEDFAQDHMSVDELANKFWEYMLKYPNMVSIVGDTLGYGRGIVTELQNRKGIPIKAAEERGNKGGSIALMNSDFLFGRIKCDPGRPIAKEWLKLFKRIHPKTRKVIMDHTDLGDAGLYGWKEAQHWASTDFIPEPTPGTPLYWQKVEQDAIDKAVSRRKENKNTDGGWWGKPLSSKKGTVDGGDGWQ